jgi:hypothetical protein
MWRSAAVAIRLFRRRLEGLKPLSHWERGWGEGFTLSNFRAYVAKHCNTHHRAERPHPRPLSQWERGEVSKLSAMAALKFSHPERLRRRLCLVKGDVRVLAHKLWRQGVKSTSSTREARPLTPKLAQKQSSRAFKRSRAMLEGVLSVLLVQTMDPRSCMPSKPRAPNSVEVHPPMSASSGRCRAIGLGRGRWSRRFVRGR